MPGRPFGFINFHSGGAADLDMYIMTERQGDGSNDDAGCSQGVRCVRTRDV